MLHPDFAQELIKRRNHDLDVRQQLIADGKLLRGYNPDMEAVHLDNARRLQEIIDQIGWPAQEQVGEEASQAAWLLVQHAISLPTFMKSVLALLNEQRTSRTIDPVNVAFLSDRIAMYENRPQSYGTQFICNEQSQLEPYQLDGPVDQVNQRRQQLGLNTVEERLAELAAQMNVEQEKPQTAAERQTEQQAYEDWRRRVGWITT
jgi:primosomal protein N''